MDLICALTPGDLQDRARAWRALAEQALTRDAEPGLVRSTYPRALLDTTRALIAAEAECCPFLRFEVTERGERFELELRYPDEFGPVLERMMSLPAGSEERVR